MPTPKLLSQIQELADGASVRADEYSGIISTVKGYIVDNFGQTGLYAAYIALAVILLFIVTRMAKMTISAVKFLVIPSIALAFLATFFLPYSFAAMLPASVTLCSLFLLFKG